METLLRHIGADTAAQERVRAALARALRDDFAGVVERSALRTMKLPGYEVLTLAQVLPNTHRGMTAVLASLEHDSEAFARMFAAIAHERARQGLSPRSLLHVVALTEEVLHELAGACLRGAEELLVAAHVVRRISDGARGGVDAAFDRAHYEAREAALRLARQFSAPVLPVLPGVLLLPIVGAVASERAREILDVMLASVARHAAHTVLLDLTGLTDLEVGLAEHLRRAAAAVRLLGARLVLVGLGPAGARLLAGAGLPAIDVHASLDVAVITALAAARR